MRQDRSAPVRLMTLSGKIMRRIALQDLANVFCQMFVGWRMQEDLQMLIGAGNCSITIDIVEGTTFLDDNPIKLHIAEEIREVAPVSRTGWRRK